MSKLIRDIDDEIKAEIRKSEKMGNATRLYYYKWVMKEAMIAIASYERFINSWAGIQWFKKHQSDIETMTNELNHRFLKSYKVEFPK